MGNHEINDEDSRNRIIYIFGPTDFYFDIGKSRFICLTNCYPAPGLVSTGENVYYKFTSSQLDWLENLLDERNSNIINTVHTPSYLELYVDVTYLITAGAVSRLVPWLCPTPYVGSFHHFIQFDLFEDGNIQGNVIRPNTIDDSVVTLENNSIYSFFIEHNSIKQTKRVTNSQNPMIIYPNLFNDATQIKVSELSEILIYYLEGHLIHAAHV